MATNRAIIHRLRFFEAFMANTLKLPVGIENFEEIRKLGFYYIDKTRLIE